MPETLFFLFASWNVFARPTVQTLMVALRYHVMFETIKCFLSVRLRDLKSAGSFHFGRFRAKFDDPRGGVENVNHF